ncbi:MAGa3780 family membrane protein [Metamycoplasma neophronis]|nr:hypothetical protein [Metamycoplasma neophronis]
MKNNLFNKDKTQETEDLNQILLPWYKKFPFISKDKKRLAAFWTGISMLLLWCITFVASWVSDSFTINEAILKLDAQTKSSMVEAGVFPSISGAFLQVRFTFTYISNILISLSLIIYAVFPKYLWTKRFLYLATIYISITFLGFWGVIIPFIFAKPELWYEIPLSWKFLSVPVHLINPIAGIAIFILLKKNMVVSNKTLLFSPLMIIAYYLFTVMIFFIGAKDVDSFVNGISADTGKGFDIYSKMQVSIYPFLNFRNPFGYSGESLTIKVLLNLIIPLGGIALCIGVGYFWKAVCKIQTYNKKDFLNKDFITKNRLLFKH